MRSHLYQPLGSPRDSARAHSSDIYSSVSAIMVISLPFDDVVSCLLVLRDCVSLRGGSVPG